MKDKISIGLFGFGVVAQGLVHVCDSPDGLTGKKISTMEKTSSTGW